MLQFLPAHLAAIILLFTLGITWKIILCWFVLWILVGGIGIEVGYHRSLSHNHFTFSDKTKKILALIGLFGMNGPPMSWRGVHVVHHRFADTDKDYHSPVKGRLNAYIGYTWKFTKEPSPQNMTAIIATKHMSRDKFWLFLEKWAHIAMFTLLCLLIMFLPHAALVMSLVMITCYNQTALVNLISHSGLGKRIYNTNDNSVNNKLLSFFTFGLSIHNNHHAFPNKENFESPGYIDFGYYLGMLIKKLDK